MVIFCTVAMWGYREMAKINRSADFYQLAKSPTNCGDIRSGKALVPCKAPGLWALPGGEETSDINRAKRVARYLDKQMHHGIKKGCPMVDLFTEGNRDA